MSQKLLPETKLNLKSTQSLLKVDISISRQQLSKVCCHVMFNSHEPAS